MPHTEVQNVLNEAQLNVIAYWAHGYGWARAADLANVPRDTVDGWRFTSPYAQQFLDYAQKARDEIALDGQPAFNAMVTSGLQLIVSAIDGKVDLNDKSIQRRVALAERVLGKTFFRVMEAWGLQQLSAPPDDLEDSEPEATP